MFLRGFGRSLSLYLELVSLEKEHLPSEQSVCCIKVRFLGREQFLARNCGSTGTRQESPGDSVKASGAWNEEHQRETTG